MENGSKRYQDHRVDEQDTDIMTKIVAMYAKMEGHDLDDPILDRRGKGDASVSLENRLAVQKAVEKFLEKCKQVAQDTARETSEERVLSHHTITQEDLNEAKRQCSEEKDYLSLHQMNDRLATGELQVGRETKAVYDTVTVDRRPGIARDAKDAMRDFTDALRAAHVFDAMEIGVEKMSDKARRNLDGLPAMDDMTFDEYDGNVLTGASHLFGHNVKDGPVEAMIGIAKAFETTNMKDLAAELNKQEAGMRARRMLFQREAGPEFASAAEKLQQQSRSAPAFPGE